MASKATEIFKMYPNFYDEDARRLLEKGDDPFNFKGFHVTESVEDSKRLIDKHGAVIIAGSGMCTGGRIIHHLKNNLESPKTHVVIVGYQVEGTLGRKLVEGEEKVNIFGTDVEVNAQIHTLGSFSAHADQRDLRYWLRSFGHFPKTIFITHGDKETAIGFASNIKTELDLEVEVPEMEEEFNLN
jgi:metallo-beta-lactamase family protein